MSTQSVSTLVPWLADASLKASLLLAAAGLLTAVLHRRGAALRHLVWTAAVFGALVLPVATAVLPTWHLHLLPAEETAVALPEQRWPANPATTLVQLPARNENGLIAGGSTPSLPAAPATLPAVGAPSFSLASWLPLLWLGGVVTLSLPLLAGLSSLWYLRRRSQVLRSGRLAELAQRLAAELGLRRQITLITSARREVPMTWGLARPVILLPADAATWPTERLRAALLHELAHVARWDCLALLLAQVLRAIYWFNPLVWLACRQIRLEQEQACDDLVVYTGQEPAEYAEHLLTITAGHAARRFLQPPVPAMGRGRRLEYRLRAILDQRRGHQPLSRRGLAGVLSLGLALLLMLAPLSPATPLPVNVDAEPVSEQDPQKQEALKRVADVREKLRQHAVNLPDDKTLTDAAIRGMLQALQDVYSEYLEPERFSEFEKATTGSLSGIGAMIQLKDEKLTVTAPLPRSPAIKAGIKPGDVIVAINGEPTKDLTVQQAVQKIAGKAGTDVKLRVLRDGKENDLTIRRGQVQLETVFGVQRAPDDSWNWFLDPESKIGYLHLTQFGQNTVTEVSTALEQLQANGMKGLILDLRLCPGGRLDMVLGVVNLFLKQGKIVTIKGTKDEGKTFEADGSAKGDYPMIVLSNETTASAAEIVAGSLQENKRAVVLGTRSFGKGSVQNILPIEGGGVIKLTTAQYFLPSGRTIHRAGGSKTWGVDPNDGFYVPMSADQRDGLRQAQMKREYVDRATGAAPKRSPEEIETQFGDPQLAAALKAMRARLETGSFAKVGQGNAALLATVQRKEDIQKRRDELLKNLQQLDKELADLEKVARDK